MSHDEHHETAKSDKSKKSSLLFLLANLRIKSVSDFISVKNY